jgi:hypothetical protein
MLPDPALSWAVSERMSVKRETPEPIGQRDAENVGHPRLRSPILRKRILAFFIIVLTALMLTIYAYYRTAYERSAGDWRGFWVYTVLLGGWLVFVVVQVLRKGP